MNRKLSTKGKISYTGNKRGLDLFLKTLELMYGKDGKIIDIEKDPVKSMTKGNFQK